MSIEKVYTSVKVKVQKYVVKPTLQEYILLKPWMEGGTVMKNRVIVVNKKTLCITAAVTIGIVAVIICLVVILVR